MATAEAFKESQLELVVHASSAPFQDLLDCQKELFLSQIDQLQNIVVTQCKLTGANPLSQEMAAGALSIKIGKRPRDLLNPKAIRYMHSVFSIKDAVNKKECREISALFGVTVTQVREYFATQRSRVRKFVRLSKEKAIRVHVSTDAEAGVPSTDESAIAVIPVPLNCVTPDTAEEPSCSTQNEVLAEIDETDRYFIESIFTSMRKENTFSGQVNLMERILQIQNPAVLFWFLTKDSVMILATWLSQAAIEEQTSVLHVILKVFCHLPLHKALPVHMSAILQSVNKLRFYRISDISNRARVLLSRWSKVFARSQALRKPNSIKSLSAVQDEMLLKQSIGEVMGSEPWVPEIVSSEVACTSGYGCSENLRKEAPQSLKLLPASADDNSKKLIRGVASSQTRERRKVLMVEQPGQKTAGRNPHVSKPVSATQSRPLSADDIQKAKMRAQFLQNKYGKAVVSSSENPDTKMEGPSKCSSHASILLSAPTTTVLDGEESTPQMHQFKESNLQEAPLCNKVVSDLDLQEPSWKKCINVQVRWQMPPEMRINSAWRVGTGDNSKEVGVQKNRIQREKETIYKALHEIPLDPKDPWDREMDHDDTLTPVIPSEQLPDDGSGDSVVGIDESEESKISFEANMTSQNTNCSMAEPDLELLAALLKNPELVYALTSGRGGSLSNEETIRLLDMIKSNRVATLGNVNGLSREVEKKVEVSLPSPTPSNDPATNRWRPEFAKNPFSRHSTMVSTGPHDIPQIVAPAPSQVHAPSDGLILAQISSSTFLPKTFPQVPQQSVPPISFPQMTAVSQDIRLPSSIPSLQQAHSLPNIFAAASTPMRVETIGNLKPVAVESTRSVFISPPSSLPPVPSHSRAWDVRQGRVLNHQFQDHQNLFNAMPSGPRRTMRPSSWETSDDVSEAAFESWSPENSPTKRHGYVPRWNHSGPGVNYSQNYRVEGSRSRDQYGYRDHRDNRWNERRR